MLSLISCAVTAAHPSRSTFQRISVLFSINLEHCSVDWLELWPFYEDEWIRISSSSSAMVQL